MDKVKVEVNKCNHSHKLLSLIKKIWCFYTPSWSKHFSHHDICSNSNRKLRGSVKYKREFGCQALVESRKALNFFFPWVLSRSSYFSSVCLTNIIRIQPYSTSVAQQITINFLTWEEVRPSEILTRLRERIGAGTPSKTYMYVWHKGFCEGSEMVENQRYGQHPRTSITNETIRAITGLLDENRRLAVDKIFSLVGSSHREQWISRVWLVRDFASPSPHTSLNHRNVHSIIWEDLAFSKISARWVSGLLLLGKKTCVWKFCQSLLAHYAE